MKKTIPHKLLPISAEQHRQLLDIIILFNTACNWVSEKANELKIYNKIELHKHVYYEVRQRFNLSSQLAVRVIGKVTDSYKLKKQQKSIHVFKKYGAIDYDSRIATINNKTKVIHHFQSCCPFLIFLKLELNESTVWSM